MKTKKSIPSAFQIFKRTRSNENNMPGIKLKKKKKRPSSNHDSSSISSDPTPVISEIQNPTPSTAVPMLMPRDFHPPPCGNVESEKCFSWLLNPVKPSDFFADTWEKKPLHIINRNPKHYSTVFSCEEFDRILRNNHLEFEKNIDVVVYQNGQRETKNSDGRAYAAVVWDYFENGYSIRLLNPQTYSKSVWRMCSLLQEYFGSFVGVNMYLTPPGSQGFAPHYDDIEAFVLQIEGVKEWKVYSPRKPEEKLPRHSSRNFAEDEIGEPILEAEVHPGDLLYFPRGFIHQARTQESSHSLHLTISTYQKNTYGDLLTQVLPRALQMAMAENIAYRESLPRDYMNYMGQANLDKDCPEKEQFVQKLFRLTKGLVGYLQLDTGADLMAKDFIHSSHPPCLTQSEKSTSIHGAGEKWIDGRVQNFVEIKPESEIRLIRKRAVCLVREEGFLRLYHSFENSRVYKEKDPQYVEIDFRFDAAVQLLINSYPSYLTVEQLPLETQEDQMDIASLLYDKGIIHTRVPLDQDSDSDSS